MSAIRKSSVLYGAGRLRGYGQAASGYELGHPAGARRVQRLDTHLDDGLKQIYKGTTDNGCGKGRLCTAGPGTSPQVCWHTLTRPAKTSRERHRTASTREALEQYDPDLFALINRTMAYRRARGLAAARPIGQPNLEPKNSAFGPRTAHDDRRTSHGPPCGPARVPDGTRAIQQDGLASHTSSPMSSPSGSASTACRRSSSSS